MSRMVVKILKVKIKVKVIAGMANGTVGTIDVK